MDAGFAPVQAEGKDFEPSRRLTTSNGFRDFHRRGQFAGHFDLVPQPVRRRARVRGRWRAEVSEDGAARRAIVPVEDGGGRGAAVELALPAVSNGERKEAPRGQHPGRPSRSRGAGHTLDPAREPRILPRSRRLGVACLRATGDNDGRPRAHRLHKPPEAGGEIGAIPAIALAPERGPELDDTARVLGATTMLRLPVRSELPADVIHFTSRTPRMLRNRMSMRSPSKAEGERFELSRRLTTSNGFRDRRANCLFVSKTLMNVPMRAADCAALDRRSPPTGESLAPTDS
jgi:hypothetical protein